MAQSHHLSKDEKKALYLERMADIRYNGSVRMCIAGICSRQMVYEWRKDPEFVEREKLAQQDYRDQIHEAFMKRAVHGSRGKVLRRKDGSVIMETDPLSGKEIPAREELAPNDNLLMRLKETEDPRFKQATKHEVTGGDGEPLKEPVTTIKFVFPDGHKTEDDSDGGDDSDEGGF